MEVFNTNKTLLYLEDDEEIRGQFIKILTPYFKTILIGINGKEGLELYQKHRPEIVITDIKMPLMNGLEISKAIKNIDKNTKIIIVSAYQDTEYFLDAIDIGVNQFILKPIIIDKLLQAIKKSFEIY